MPRPTVKVDLVLMNEIAKRDICKTFDNASQLYKYIALEYNMHHNSMLFPVNIDWQLVGLRIKSGDVKLNYPLPVGKRGKQPGTKLSPQHLEKMKIGRKTKAAIENAVKDGLPANFSQTVVLHSDGMMTKWEKNMREDFAGKNTLLNGVLAGKARACVKAMCINCMGGYLNRQPEDPALTVAIRDCRGVDCPLYLIRPFQKKNVAGENT